MTETYKWGDQPGCTCGPYMSVIPPPPCPYHSAPQWVLVPVMPHCPCHHCSPAAPTTRWYPATNTTGTITVRPENTTTITYTS